MAGIAAVRLDDVEPLALALDLGRDPVAALPRAGPGKAPASARSWRSDRAGCRGWTAPSASPPAPNPAPRLSSSLLEERNGRDRESDSCPPIDRFEILHRQRCLL